MAFKNFLLLSSILFEYLASIIRVSATMCKRPDEKDYVLVHSRDRKKPGKFRLTATRTHLCWNWARLSIYYGIIWSIQKLRIYDYKEDSTGYLLTYNMNILLRYTYIVYPLEMTKPTRREKSGLKRGAQRRSYFAKRPSLKTSLLRERDSRGSGKR